MPRSQDSVERRSLLVSSEPGNDTEFWYPAKTKHRKRLYLTTVAFITISCLGLGFVGGWLFNIETISFNTQTLSEHFTVGCPSPSNRREWRSLSRLEKNHYIEAIQCLRTTPSHLGLNQTLYDDFPWVHSRVGQYSHGAAAFLAWHRYFIHVYERTLRETCGYTGNLTYWNWSLDWEDLTSAPVWDSETGFGGNGNFSADASIVHGHCVTDGPFAGLQVLYTDATFRPHCLSRGFESSETLEQLALNITPTALEHLLDQSDYGVLNLGLEDGAHISVPRSVRGDFSLFTAPYDPVFFLHHTNLDRLWWAWQQANPQKRLLEYVGKSSHDSLSKATIEDIIPMGGLAPDVKVSEIMGTESGLLCYKY